MKKYQNRCVNVWVQILVAENKEVLFDVYAKSRCPGLLVVPSGFDKCEEISEQVRLRVGSGYRLLKTRRPFLRSMPRAAALGCWWCPLSLASMKRCQNRCVHVRVQFLTKGRVCILMLLALESCWLLHHYHHVTQSSQSCWLLVLNPGTPGAAKLMRLCCCARLFGVQQH
jgi:hypothetical protein